MRQRHSERRLPEVQPLSRNAASASLDPVDSPLAAFLESGPPAYIADRDGRILYANAGYEAIALLIQPPPPGPGRALMTALQVAALSEDQPLRREQSLLAGQQTQPCIVEHRLLRHDGEVKGVVAQVLPQEDVRKARDALALAQERLDDVTRLVSDWVWETDRKLDFTFLSPRVSQVLGYHPLELVGRSIASLAPELETAGVFDRQRPRPFRDRKVEITDRDGCLRVFLLSGLPIFGRGDGRFLGYRGTAQDITELTQRERALRDAKEVAEAANRAKSDFLANMSHELRTPLNAIIGFSEIMSSEIFGPMENRQYHAYADDILESARHLLTLINDILDVAKIEAGKFELNEEAVDPCLLGEQAARTLAAHAQRAGLELTARLPRPAPLLRADALKLRQVLLNLLSNAVKFTESGGRVRLETLRPPEGGFLFRVSDNGIGMSPRDLQMALEPFTQVDSVMSRRHEGTGLGLPLARALTELHGGRLEIESAPGAGTRVEVVLPEERVIAPGG